MLKDYLENLSQLRESHPISQAELEAWRSDKITKQLFEDMERLAIFKGYEVHAINYDVAGLQAAKLNGVQDTSDFVINWVPEFLEENDD